MKLVSVKNYFATIIYKNFNIGICQTLRFIYLGQDNMKKWRFSITGIGEVIKNSLRETL